MNQITTISPTKAERAAAIVQSAEIISRHYGIKPEKLFVEVQSKSPVVREARGLLIHHLHTCGMSYVAIGKIIGRSCDSCQRFHTHAKIRMMDEDRALLAKLPAIPNTLQISISGAAKE